ncbi:MAG TPA: hypothetical protein DCY20_09190 [Firmicutes bacterium]|nr:hypothetical protein [Bacillota bacterium]
MELLNTALIITNDNRVYNEQTQALLHPNRDLSDAKIVDIYQRYVKSHESLELNHAVITVQVMDDCIKLSYEPLQKVKAYMIQGEIPTEVFIRFGRRLSLNDWSHLSKQLENGMFGNIYAC